MKDLSKNFHQTEKKALNVFKKFTFKKIFNAQIRTAN